MPRRRRRAVESSSQSGAERVARRALQRFVVAGLVALLLISIATVLVLALSIPLAMRRG